MVKATERFAGIQAQNYGIGIIRKWAHAEEVFTAVNSSESKGVGFYRVAFTVADIPLGKAIDLRPRQSERGYITTIIAKLGDILRRFFS